jgi:hypothetical protein
MNSIKLSNLLRMLYVLTNGLNIQIHQRTKAINYFCTRS